MSTLLLNIPNALQICCVFLFGTIFAAFANYCVDRFGWTPRYRSPWRRFPQGVDAPRRRWSDRIPIWGWLALSRFSVDNKFSTKKRISAHQEGVQNSNQSKKASIPQTEWNASNPFSKISGWENRYFWIYPFFAELIFAALITWRYSTLVVNSASISDASTVELERAFVFWCAETFLFWFALCVSTIDFNDYVVPDVLIVPSALAGLTISTLYPVLTIYPTRWPLAISNATSTNDFFLFAARIETNCGINATPETVRALVFAALASIWTFWNFALLDRRWYLRLGLRRAAAIFCRRLRRSKLTPIIATLWILGTFGIASVVWSNANSANAAAKFASVCAHVPLSNDLLGLERYPLTATDGLANALLGLFVGATLIWAVRLVAGKALGVEAMGFGDVLLLGSIGAFLGWEGALVVFFVAPFFGLIFGIGRRFFDSAPEIPYGPFLCGGALLYSIERERFHLFLEPFFNDPIFVAGIGAFGFVLLAILLFSLRILRNATQHASKK